MSEAFLTALAEALKAAGIPAKYDGMYLVVGEAGVKFDAEDRKNGRVRFLGSSFKCVETDDDKLLFDVSKAVGLLIANLPERLRQKESQKLATDRMVAIRENWPKSVCVVDDTRLKAWLQVSGVLPEGVFVATSPGGYEAKIVTDDVETFKLAVAHLQELTNRG